MSAAVLTISNKNYSSWSLRGWLLCKIAGLEIVEQMASVHDTSMRAELLLISPSFLVPSLQHQDIKIWDTLSIAEYLNEIRPESGLYPADRAARAHCRSISGEMHAGFYNLRSALPMNLRSRHPGFKILAGAHADIVRIIEIWSACLRSYGGPYLFGASPTVADAMFAPVCTRFWSYDVRLDGAAAAYRDSILAWPAVLEWSEDALAEQIDLEELDVEF
ncbi:MAG: glutathione S-transferase [Pseudomonadota bacterium]|nr:glutathione S-transferase [Pseudomonadota bacterium]